MKVILSIELLKGLEREDWECISQLIDCQYFNSDKAIIRLFDALKKRKLNRAVFDDEFQCFMYMNVFPHLPKPIHKLTKNQNSQLNRKLNGLMRIVEQYLMIEALRTNEISKKKLLYPELLKRSQYLSLARHFNQADKSFSKVAAKGEKYYDERYEVEDAKLDMLRKKDMLVSKDNLNELNEVLDLRYILYKQGLHLTALSLTRRSTAKNYDFSSFEATEALLKLPQYAAHPMVISYQLGIELLKNPSESVYREMAEVLEKSKEMIPAEQLKFYYTTIANYCIGEMSTGKAAYRRELFETFKKMHENNLFVEAGVIPVGELKNIITVACLVEEYEWGEAVISFYEKNIPSGIRRSVYEFNRGTIAFSKKDYRTAQMCFNIADGNIDNTHDINIKILILKCLYEEEEGFIEATLQRFRTTERFFKNHKSLPPNKKKGYINFVKLAIHLYRIRYRDAKKVTIKKVKIRLEQYAPIIDKRWLVEKISELEAV